MSGCTHPASAQYNDRANGIITCTLCGDVVQDPQFELDPVFARGEKSTRLRSLGHLRPTRGVINLRLSSARPSIEAARRGMTSFARQLAVSDDMVETALAVYKMAVSMNAVSGARPVVLCAALYAVCRRERTSHMVYDFAEVAGENPYDILSYMQLICETTHTDLPVIDPSCMVHRFAEQLNLGHQTAAVVICALKVLRAMRDDWIACGRRPMGVCVAALLVACYMFNIPRSPDEVCGFVKLTAGTIAKRLDEFARTKTASLENIDDYTRNEGSLPPSFTQLSRRRGSDEVDVCMRQLSAMYYGLVAEAKVSTPSTPERCKIWQQFLTGYCQLKGITPPEDVWDLTKLSARQQLQILGLPNTEPMEPEKVKESVKREEEKILMKMERSSSNSATPTWTEHAGVSLPTLTDPPLPQMVAYYNKLMTEDPNVIDIRRTFDEQDVEGDVETTISPRVTPQSSLGKTSLAEGEACPSLIEALFDKERRFALPWEFIVLQDPEKEDCTDLELYMVLDNEERIRRQKVNVALYGDSWDLGKPRTREEMERLEESRTTRKRQRQLIGEHATVEDALTRALRGRGAATVNVSYINELVPGLESRIENTSEDWDT
ncbi:putative Transcription factor TFIIB repeat [Trypanosoma vivax]|nr:putative transcription factor [Trypanosoma vivax]KAH8619066.1 putative Transcription factor TFIIB repeat [Trypanosoma vivax]